jgi:hypothetical protein
VHAQPHALHSHAHMQVPRASSRQNSHPIRRIKKMTAPPWAISCTAGMVAPSNVVTLSAWICASDGSLAMSVDAAARQWLARKERQHQTASPVTHVPV